MPSSRIAANRRARFDYEITDRYDAGLVLTGSEIKSAREGRVQLAGSYVRIKGGEVWLEDCHIAPYANAGYTPHDPTRPRKLLLHAREIRRLEEAVGEQGLSIVPLTMYLKRGMAKVEIGVGRGRKRYDKRQKIAERDVERQIARAVRR